jgi:hypothetical protein
MSMTKRKGQIMPCHRCGSPSREGKASCESCAEWIRADAKARYAENRDGILKRLKTWRSKNPKRDKASEKRRRDKAKPDRKRRGKYAKARTQ